MTVFKSQGWGLSSSYSSVQGLLSAPQFRAYYYHIHLDERVGLHPSLHPCPDWRPCDTCQGFRGRAHSGWVSSRPGILVGYPCLRVLPEGCSAYSSSVLPCCKQCRVAPPRTCRGAGLWVRRMCAPAAPPCLRSASASLLPSLSMRGNFWISNFYPSNG